MYKDKNYHVLWCLCINTAQHHTILDTVKILSWPILPNYTTNLVRRTFLYRDPDMWRKLADAVTKVPGSLRAFKNVLTRHMHAQCRWYAYQKHSIVVSWVGGGIWVMETNYIKYINYIKFLWHGYLSLVYVWHTIWLWLYNVYKMMSTDPIYWGIQDTLIVYVFVMCICKFIGVVYIWINIYLSKPLIMASVASKYLRNGEDMYKQWLSALLWIWKSTFQGHTYCIIMNYDAWDVWNIICI